MLPRRARVELGAMAMKGRLVFPKATALQEPHNQIVQCHIKGTHWGVGSVLPLCRGVVGVFYSPCRLGNFLNEKLFSFIRSIDAHSHNLDRL